MLKTHTVASFRDLLTEVSHTFRRTWKELVLVSLIAGLAASVARAGHAWQTQEYYDHLLDQTGIARDIDALDALLEQRRMGNTTLNGEINDVRGRIGARLNAVAGSDVNTTPTGIALAAMLALANLLIIIAVFAWTITRTLDPFSHWRMNMREAASRFARLAALCIALFLLSLLWIPGLAILYAHMRQGPLLDPIAAAQTALIFVGYLVAVLLLPRLSLAPTVLMEKNLGVRAALLESYERSRGHWSKLLGNLLAVVVSLTVLCSALFRILRELLQYDAALLLLPTGFLFHLSVITFGVFLTHLSNTIIEHPSVQRISDERAG